MRICIDVETYIKLSRPKLLSVYINGDLVHQIISCSQLFEIKKIAEKNQSSGSNLGKWVGTKRPERSM